MSNSNWFQSDIYQTLIKRSDRSTEQIRSLLNSPRVMPKIAAILDLGNTTPKDFTLHNADHSFRVAQKMWQLIPDSTKAILSDYEMGLLLLAAYLHDIGMSPENDKVQRHLDYLTRQKEGVLSDAEIYEFQQWIDNDPRAGNIDIRTTIVDDKDQVNYLLSYYIRYKHNDWSGDWIRKNLANEELTGYPRWINDLILICQSHHHGMDHLLQENFDPYPLSSGMIIHLRYLAICLRVADVMENDPERTPEVILSHRQISAGSLSFWLKDHQFSLTRKEDTYAIHARPERAFIHRAIVETADLIERELKLSDEIKRRKRLDWSPILDLSNYKWTIDPILNRDIRPAENSYEYIQGSFRPNTAKILELLAGHQLYGDTIWAYRELLQNAFDAVKERIAYKLIHEQLDPGENASLLGKSFGIDLSLVRKDDGIWLICKDHGVGMTKSIIEGYFLQSGLSKRHEIKELERECQKNGFNLGRTGQFGIGVLSYFMLAEKIIVKTKREFNTGYSPGDSIGWKFEISGTHDFGELARFDPAFNGTQLELKLKPEITADIAEWDRRFESFLKESITRTPCALRYASFLGSNVKIAPGWTNDQEDIKARIQRQAQQDITESSTRFRREPEMVSSYGIEKQKSERLFVLELLNDLRDSLDFFSTEGQIVDHIKYRIHIPFFKLKKGNSFFFLKETIEEGMHRIDGVVHGQAWMPDMHLANCSVKGIRVKLPEKPDESEDEETPAFPFVHVEIDFENIDESKLEISRKTFHPDATLYKEIEHQIDLEIKRLIKENTSSFDNCYGLMNFRFTGLIPSEFYWIFAISEGYKIYELKEIGFPILQRNIHKRSSDELFFRGKPVHTGLRNVGHYNHFGYYDRGISHISWEQGFKLSCQTGLFPEEHYVVYPIIMHPPTAILRGRFHEIELPEEWDKVLFLTNTNSGLTLLNTRHPLFHLYDPDLVELFSELGAGNSFPEVGNKAACYNFLIYALSHYSGDEWIALCERDPYDMEDLFDALGMEKAFFMNEYELVLVGVDSYRGVMADEDISVVLPAARDERYYLRPRSDAGTDLI